MTLLQIALIIIGLIYCPVITIGLLLMGPFPIIGIVVFIIGVYRGEIKIILKK